MRVVAGRSGVLYTARFSSDHGFSEFLHLLLPSIFLPCLVRTAVQSEARARAGAVAGRLGGNSHVHRTGEVAGLGEAPARGLLGAAVPSAGLPGCETRRGTTPPTVHRGALSGTLRAPRLGLPSAAFVGPCWGGVVVRVELGREDGSGSSVPQRAERTCSVPGARNSPGGSVGPLHSAGTSGGSGTDRALSPTCLQFRDNERGQNGWTAFMPFHNLFNFSPTVPGWGLSRDGHFGGYLGTSYVLDTILNAGNVKK